MITHIHYSNGFYAIEIDGQIVGHASTQHEADVLLSTIQEAEASWQMGGMSNVGQSMLRCGLPNPLYRVQQAERPLLAQCAEVIRACLGGPVIGGGIVEELRRVEQALAQEGW